MGLFLPNLVPFLLKIVPLLVDLYHPKPPLLILSPLLFNVLFTLFQRLPDKSHVLLNLTLLGLPLVLHLHRKHFPEIYLVPPLLLHLLLLL